MHLELSVLFDITAIMSIVNNIIQIVISICAPTSYDHVPHFNGSVVETSWLIAVRCLNVGEGTSPPASYRIQNLNVEVGYVCQKRLVYNPLWYLQTAE